MEDIPTEIKNDPFASALLPSGVETDITVIKAETDDITILKQQIRDGEIISYIIVPVALVASEESDEDVEVFIPGSFSPNHTGVVTTAASRSIVNVRLRRLGHNPENIRSLLHRPSVATTRLAEDGGETLDNEVARRLIPMAFMMLLWIATFTSGNYLLTTTIEEKSNKVIEVLLSAISPMQLLAGKILGQAGVSTVILCMYGSVVMAGLVAFAMLDLIPIYHLVLFATYFVIAYFMIATIMTAVGSAVSELSDAQSLMGPIMLLLLVPLLLWPILLEHPNGLVATITSFTPPLLPFIMILRVTTSTEPVATWQIILSIVIGFGSVIAMVWMCARIFRIGVLMQGKPPSILQLAKWIRQG